MVYHYTHVYSIAAEVLVWRDRRWCLALFMPRLLQWFVSPCIKLISVQWRHLVILFVGG
jgi:hypothetical protein